jgi:hypothetical protein
MSLQAFLEIFSRNFSGFAVVLVKSFTFGVVMKEHSCFVQEHLVWNCITAPFKNPRFLSLLLHCSDKG